MNPERKIPVYAIENLQMDLLPRPDFQIEDLFTYVQKHYSDKHTPHRHSFFHMVFFTGGAGSFTVDFERFTVQPGQMYCMIPGQVHSWHFTGAVEGYVINFSEQYFRNFLFDQYYLDRFSFFSGHSSDSVFQVPEVITGRVQGLFSEINVVIKDKKQHPDLVWVLLLQLLLIVQSAVAADGPKVIPEQKRLLLYNLKRLIDTHFKDIRLPKQYADLLYVTPNYLNALCQDLLGMTAGEVIRNRVLLEAKRLLINETITVAEVAYRLSFQDNSYFSRFFRKYEGITPEAFRKQFLKQE